MIYIQTDVRSLQRRTFVLFSALSEVISETQNPPPFPPPRLVFVALLFFRLSDGKCWGSFGDEPLGLEQVGEITSWQAPVGASFFPRRISWLGSGWQHAAVPPQGTSRVAQSHRHGDQSPEPAQSSPLWLACVEVRGTKCHSNGLFFFSFCCFCLEGPVGFV